MAWLNQLMKWLPYIALLIVYVTGGFVDIMEVDAAQYASISREMLESGNYLEVFHRGENYLDKPPLLFWLSALSMKLFGVSTWAYKLPSILFSLLGVFSTYKLGEQLYTSSIGRHAALIFGSCLATVIINNDIKTDTILVSAIVFSIWMLVAYLDLRSWKYLVGAAVGIAAAMLTKGPIGVMMPFLAIGGHIILKREWKRLLDYRWIILIILVAVLLLPMCIGLYQQHGISGLKFYFWTQSFGRITGENSWRNDTTVFFFSHVFMWSFIPWSLIALGAIVRALRGFGTDLKRPASEFYLISGVVLVTLALSLSKFKLPHYIFVVYPLVAILTAKYIQNLKNHSTWAWTQLVHTIFGVLVLIFLLLYCFPNGGYCLPVLLFLSVIGAIIYMFNSYRAEQVIMPAFILSIAIGLGLNLHFYPQLLSYQANSMAGKWVSSNEIEKDRFIGFATGGHALDFYADGIVPWLPEVASTINIIKPGVIVYTNEGDYHELKRRGVAPIDTMRFPNYPVQNLSLIFLNPKTREETLKNHYLLFY